jgi:hypothetical protein
MEKKISFFVCLRTACNFKLIYEKAILTPFFTAPEPFSTQMNNLQITDLTFKRANYLQLSFVQVCTFSNPINGKCFWALPLVLLFHMMPEIIIAIIAPFPR